MSRLFMKWPGLSLRRASLLWLLPAALIGSMLSAPPVVAQAPSAVPVPAATLTRVNVPGTTPMSATAVDLAAAGYTAREFYAAGLANRYTGADANAFTTASVLDSVSRIVTRGATYKEATQAATLTPHGAHELPGEQLLDRPHPPNRG